MIEGALIALMRRVDSLTKGVEGAEITLAHHGETSAKKACCGDAD